MLLYTHTLEVHSEFATLYLRGALGGTDVGVARATCARLPRSIRLLRIDASGIDDMDASARKEIGRLVHYWRRERLGHVIVVGLQENRDTIAVDPRLAYMADMHAYVRPVTAPCIDMRAEDQALAGIYL